MAAAIDIRIMTTDDIPLGMRLKYEAGWNQIEADWQRVLALEPEGCFVGSCSGIDVGTVVTTVFDHVAWVSMMLVDSAIRGRGIGRALMAHALAYLDNRGIRSVRLDATPLGRPLYESLGFCDDFELARYSGCVRVADEALFRLEPSDVPTHAAEILPVAESHLDQIATLDQECTGTNRRRWLERIVQEWQSGCYVLLRDSKVTAFAMKRAGFHGTLIGPCLGRDPDAGRLLSHAFMSQQDQPTIIDIPILHKESNRLANGRDFRFQRALWRMTRGPRVFEDPPAIWASGGPEKG